MKQTLAMLMTAVLLLCCFAGCTVNQINVANDVPTTAAPTETTAPEETTTEPAPAKVAYIDSELTQNSDEFASAYLTVTAYDENDNVVWTYRTADCAQSELENPQMVAETEEAVYVNEQGVVVNGGTAPGYLTALDRQTGEVLWRNDEFVGASAHGCFDENGTLYLCGYYGPDCMAIDKDGKTLWTVGQVDPSCWWPYEISYEGGLIYIFYEGTDSGMEEYRCVTQEGEQFIGGF